ncbi:hypothetical protein D910_08249 [Dendroctonus ponderosae]|uniref:Uncharacterized protein n=1 Tax=Dendroctonus ponderosae TaxID=77166 RepID=U4UAH6_DENPD|nr:hypothetical protein D910_08249 [Dendroctonus ponderosae]
MENPDSPDSLASDQLTVDLLRPASRRRRLVIVSEDERRDARQTPDAPNNNNDVGFVLMDEEPGENGTEEDDEVRLELARIFQFRRIFHR